MLDGYSFDLSRNIAANINEFGFFCDTGDDLGQEYTSTIGGRQFNASPSSWRGGGEGEREGEGRGKGVVRACVRVFVRVCMCVGVRWVVVGWWWWCGPWNHKCVSVETLACVQQIKWASASALAPSAGLSSRKKTYACSLRVQVPGYPRHNPKSRKKIARLAHLTPHSFGRRGAQSFPSPRGWMLQLRNTG